MDVRYVAHLARLDLTETEIAELEPQLRRIVEYVQQLGELDLRDVEPTAHAFPVYNIFRPDRVEPCLDRESALRNAPAHRQGLFIVPPIIE